MSGFCGSTAAYESTCLPAERRVTREVATRLLKAESLIELGKFRGATHLFEVTLLLSTRE